MPNVCSFHRSLMELYQNGIVNNTAIKMVKATPFVEKTASTRTHSHPSITNLIKDTFGRILHKNTVSCNEGFWVCKTNGNNSNVSTITLFNTDGIRMLKEVCDNAVTRKVIEYDKNGLNPKKVSEITNILI